MENTRSELYKDALVVQVIRNSVVVVVVGGGGGWWGGVEAVERHSQWLWYKIGRKKTGHLELMSSDLASISVPPTKGLNLVRG